MANVKLGNQTFEGVESVKMDTTDGGEAVFTLGGGSYTGSAVYTYDSSKEYEETTGTMLGKGFKLSDDIIVADDYTDGIVLFDASEVAIEGLEGLQYAGMDGGPVESSGDGNGVFFNALFIVSQLTDEVKAVVPSAGIWLFPSQLGLQKVSFLLNRK